MSKIKDSIDVSLPIEEQARRAFKKRNIIRDNARRQMMDEELRIYLEKNKPNLSFEELIKSKMNRKGMTREEAVKDILKTSTKTNANVNKALGIEGD